VNPVFVKHTLLAPFRRIAQNPAATARVRNTFSAARKHQMAVK